MLLLRTHTLLDLDQTLLTAGTPYRTAEEGLAGKMSCVIHFPIFGDGLQGGVLLIKLVMEDQIR